MSWSALEVDRKGHDEFDTKGFFNLALTLLNILGLLKLLRLALMLLTLAFTLLALVFTLISSISLEYPKSSLLHEAVDAVEVCGVGSNCRCLGLTAGAFSRSSPRWLSKFLFFMLFCLETSLFIAHLPGLFTVTLFSHPRDPRRSLLLI